jgi:hypothetical protein
LSPNQPTSAPPPGASPIWGSYKGDGASAPAAAAPSPGRNSSPRPSALSSLVGGEPLDPLSRKLMDGVKFLSLLLVLVLANSFLNGDAESRLEFNPVAAAAERTQNYPGAKFTLYATSTSDGLPRPIHVRGYGAYNSETGRSRAVAVTSSAPKNVSIETIADQTSVYMRGGAATGEIPDNKEWIKFEPFLGQSADDVMVGTGGGPDETLQMLRAVSGDVQPMGQEQVRGVPTTRYRATLTMSGFAEAMREEGNEEMAEVYEKYAVLSPSPFLIEAWIDAEDTVRRSRMVMDLPVEKGAPALTMDMRMEFFDFGARPEIELPDSSRVIDATPYLEEELDEAGS